MVETVNARVTGGVDVMYCKGVDSNAILAETLPIALVP
jgi:hypothetical protein